MAATAGVSTATASRALNGVSTVHPDLVAKVAAAAESLGYRPNGVGRSLRRQRTDVLALIISDIGNPFFTAAARGFEDVAREAGFSVVLCNSDEDPGKEAQYLDVAERERFAGVVMSPNAVGSDIGRLRAAGIPVVAIDRPLQDEVDTVLVDSRGGAEAATSHLLDVGWKRPGCITGPASTDTSEQRLAGYRDALASRRRRQARSLVRHADYRAESAREATHSLLRQRNPPDSLFVGNSPMALGVLAACRELGLRPGTDLGLVAFDDAPWAEFVDPPMTVIGQPAYEIGMHAGRLLVDRITGAPADPPARNVLLTTQLVVRQTS